MLPLNAVYAHLTLPTTVTPELSIIIPVYGKIDYTLACLRSIANSPPSTPFEVIVVNDASPDNTASVLGGVAGLRVLHNEGNVGFVGSCNAGAAHALGKTLLFLNNDTQVLPNWADALVRTFERLPDTGIAGSQLVYPDGRLQEAGAWVFSDGSAWNIGRFESRKNPAYRYGRTVDYVSGASLAISAQLFKQVGGFDRRFAPGYYEDTDLAFAVREMGYTVRYVPDSVVVHAEGVSSGGDISSGMKQYQAINQQKFVEKWRHKLQTQPALGTPLATVDQQRHRGTIFVADVAVPDASRDSGSLRLLSLMALMTAEGWHVVFAPDDRRVNDEDFARLGALGIEIAVTPWSASIPAWIAEHGAELHAAVLCRHTVATQYSLFIRKHAREAKLIFDTVDLHFLREARAAEQAGSTSLARQATATRKQELQLINSADTTLVVSGYELDLLHRLAPNAKIELLSNIHEVKGRTKGFDGRRDLLFVGGFGHPPNADAMDWMGATLLPTLRTYRPDLRIYVAGDIPETRRDSLAAMGLDMLGRVEDLSDLMSSCLASIAPLRFGAGVKGKVNMAMSHGLPVIGTSVATEGMQLADGVDVLIANTPEAFVQAYRRLASDERLWLSLSDNGIENIRRHFSADTARATLRRILA